MARRSILTWIKATRRPHNHTPAMQSRTIETIEESPGLSASPLAESELGQAFALVALCEDGVTLEAWRRHVAACACASPSRWCAVRDGRGYMHALFSHRIDHHLVAGRLLDIGDILTAGPRWQAALAALDRSASQIAAEQRCAALRIRLDPRRQTPGPDNLRRIFTARGFVDHGPELWRLMGAPAA